MTAVSRPNPNSEGRSHAWETRISGFGFGPFARTGGAAKIRPAASVRRDCCCSSSEFSVYFTREIRACPRGHQWPGCRSGIDARPFGPGRSFISGARPAIGHHRVLQCDQGERHQRGRTNAGEQHQSHPCPLCRSAAVACSRLAGARGNRRPLAEVRRRHQRAKRYARYKQ